MPTFVKRSTLELQSGEPEDHPIQDWLPVPDNSVLPIRYMPQKYRKIVGDNVLEMDQAEKDAVDAPSLPDLKIAKRKDLVSSGWALVDQRYDLRENVLLLGFFINAKIDGKTNRAAHIQQLLDWQEGVADHVKTKVQAVNAATTVSEARAVSLNTDTIIAQDPGVTIASALAITD